MGLKLTCDKCGVELEVHNREKHRGDTSFEVLVDDGDFDEPAEYSVKAEPLRLLGRPEPYLCDVCTKYLALQAMREVLRAVDANQRLPQKGGGE